MALSASEKQVRREIEEWQHGEASALAQAVSWATMPVDWALDRSVPPEVINRASDKITDLLSTLSDASEWTYEPDELLGKARRKGLHVERVEDLRREPVETLDELARGYFSENMLLAAVEGGSTGVGGAALIAADIPLLFTINLRLIQQIAACYGFMLRGPRYRPLVLSVFNVAASGSREAKNEALREVSVAAAAFARDQEYRGRVSGTFRDQKRHIPREIAKNLIGRKLGQTIPVAGMAVGAGVNYWFTRDSAESAFMLFRALYLECKERR